MRRPSVLVCVRAAVFALPVVLACASNGGSGVQAGSQGAGNSSSTNGASGGSGAAGAAGSHDGGSGGSSGGSNGGSGTSNSGGSSGGSNGGVASSGDGGSTSGDGGSSSADASKRVCAAIPNVIADFEDDALIDVASNGFTGIWYAVADTSGGAASPVLVVAPSTEAPTGTDPNPSNPPCNKYTAHTTQALLSSATTQTYAQTHGNLLAQGPAGDGGLLAYAPPINLGDLNMTDFNGISFDVEVGTGGASSLTFEVVTTDTQPPAYGGTVSNNNGDSQYDNRGWLLSTSSTATNASTIGSSWETVSIPFALLIPHWFPASGAFAGGDCTTPGLCQAPAFNPANVLGVQFVINPDQSPGASFDLWFDNVSLYTGTAGLTPPDMPDGISPTFANGSIGSCAKPTGINVGGQYLQWAYRNWYSRFVVSAGSGALRVQRPENDDDSVSEGIAYGMLIAVYMDDPTLFAGLWQYWQDNVDSSAGNLMTWEIGGAVPNNTGTATDADQDAAFALLQAGTKFNNSSYTSAGKTMLQDIWKYDMDTTNDLPAGGSNYGNSTTSEPTNPSYFAPEYYPTFAAADPGDDWAAVAPAVYTALNTLANNTSTVGLVPGWCSDKCTEVGSNGAATDGIYQYDAHRVPLRVGLDYCWNGSSSAQSFLTKMIGFFTGLTSSSASTGGGLGQLGDEYNLNGTLYTASASPNSMSLIGCAAVGAMSGSNASFVNSAWQFLLDGEDRGILDVSPSGGMSGYSYYNATVGMLTLLALSGNFVPL